MMDLESRQPDDMTRALDHIPMVVESTPRGERTYDIPAQGAGHFPGRPARGRGCQPSGGPVALPRVGESRQGHPSLHQLAGRVGERRARDL